MSWGDIFNRVEIEGGPSEEALKADPFSWFPGRGIDAVVGAGRFEIGCCAGDELSSSGCCSGEEISDLDYRAMVVRRAMSLARAEGRKAPGTSDVARAQRSVDNELQKRDISRSYSW